ncbi:uncharacterized protein LOC111369501 isoform X6 [Olea europaea var. sylvestris]|uniref:uncharacterized protein LOC111369501 isoform X5 n=1 Tax=Olea europaea var. sylvestris TaxID=158386 RepID=UPI000C1D7AD8|nr:uncharacterized protein LOC111369501 isoform X5 [Olea europaea var. sylvestris]XP_022846809.1 uncharacterized protein LOC111369501 isoform X6 [Olea europaea var. sylvestris]
MDSNRDAPSTREEWLGTERSGRWIQQIWNAAAKAFQWQGTEASGRTRGAGTSSHVEWQGTEGSGRSTQWQGTKASGRTRGAGTSSHVEQGTATSGHTRVRSGR